MPQDSYICRHCGYVLSKKDDIISGYDSLSGRQDSSLDTDEFDCKLPLP
jgi:hypothetical protein